MAQVPVMCDICHLGEDVIFYCINCEDILCSQCKVYHLRGKRTKDDEIILLSQVGEVQKSHALLCEKHRGQDVSLYCVKCDEFICIECVAGKHNTHAVKTSKDVKASKIEDLQGKIQTLNDKTIIFDKAQEYEEKVHKCSVQSVEQCKKAIVDQKAKIFAEVTTVCDEQLAELDLLLEEESERYSNACTSISKKKSGVTSMKEQLQQMIDHGNPISLVQASDDADQFIKNIEYPAPPVTKITRFREGNINRSVVEQLQGDVLEERYEASSKTEQTQESDHITATASSFQNKEQATNAQNQINSPRAETFEHVVNLKNVKIVSTDKVSDSVFIGSTIKAILPMDDGRIWVVVDGNSHLTMIDRNRIIKRSIKACDTKVIADATTYQNELLVTCLDHQHVIQITENGDSKRIFKDLSPFHTNGLCATEDMDVIVCLDSADKVRSRIVKLGPTGIVIQTIVYDSFGIIPYKVTSMQSGHIFVTEKDGYDNKVVGFDTDGQILFTWKGEIDGNKASNFQPWCITHDKYNNLFITDFLNSRVYVLGGNRTGAKFFLDQKTGIHSPFGITVNKNGQLLLGCSDGKLHNIEY